jgi:hypothetical protein
MIDTDLGQSGASAADRLGFQRLVTEVSLGRAGLVLGLEVSRLARNCSDWHRLLEICAFTGTLILDEDGLYDPAHFNDRLLLGLKGTMSEAELHLLRARLRGGALNKAKRGELRLYLPIGLAYDAIGRVILDPRTSAAESPSGVCYLSAHRLRVCGGTRIPPARVAVSKASTLRTGSRTSGVETPYVSAIDKDPAQSPLYRRVCLRTHNGAEISRWAP